MSAASAARARGLPRARPDQRHRVEAVHAGAGPRGGGLARAGGEPGVGEDVGHDAVLAGVRRQPGLLPRRPGRAQELDERDVVDGEQRLVGLRAGGELRMAGGGQGGPDRLRARGDLGGGRAHADPDLGAWIVPRLLLAPDDRDHERAILNGAGPPYVRLLRSPLGSRRVSGPPAQRGPRLRDRGVRIGRLEPGCARRHHRRPGGAGGPRHRVARRAAGRAHGRDGDRARRRPRGLPAARGRRRAQRRGGDDRLRDRVGVADDRDARLPDLDDGRRPGLRRRRLRGDRERPGWSPTRW